MSDSVTETSRITESTLRYNILYGLWEPDLRQRVLAAVHSKQRAEAWAPYVTSANLFVAGCRALSTLYYPDAPRTAHTSTLGEAVLSAVRDGGFWEMMVRGQRDCIGIREVLVRADPFPDPTQDLLGWGLAYRLVHPHRVKCLPRPGSHRDVPALVEEQYELEGKCVRECWSVVDVTAPYHRLYDENGSLLEEHVGATYPYWDEYGQPVIPYSLYHAERTGYMFDPFEWSEAVQGTLELGVLWTFAAHAVRNASWPQKWTLGVTVPTETVEESYRFSATNGIMVEARSRVVGDPARTIDFAVDPDSSVQPQVGSWPATDPEVIARAVLLQQEEVKQRMGLGSAAVKDSGDARSGYALSVSREDMAEFRRRFEPQFRRGDTETLRVAAALLGSVSGRTLPGSGYTIEYGEKPKAQTLTYEDISRIRLVMDVVSSIGDGRTPADAAEIILTKLIGLPEDVASGLVAEAEVIEATGEVNDTRGIAEADSGSGEGAERGYESQGEGGTSSGGTPQGPVSGTGNN